VSIEIDHPRCPFCHADVVPGQGAKQSCGDCMAWHHEECWETHGGCSACNQSRSATSSRRSTPGKGKAPASRGAGLFALAACSLVGLVVAGLFLARPEPAREGPPPAAAPAIDKTWHTEFMKAKAEDEKTRWCRVGAEAGDPAAMNLLGFRLAGGIGCATDFEEAVLWGRKGAELGHSNAMFGYARMLEGGFGVPKDPAQAAHWYRRALEAGDPQAPHHLERLLLKHPDLR
jgi:TPR repeat protein